MFLLLFFIVSGIFRSGSAIPELILYNEKLSSVSTFVATTTIGNENQLCLPPEIKATRVCVNSGIWIFYPDSNYLADRAPASVLATGADGPQTCMDLPPYLDKTMGSYRPAGDPNGSLCSLNFYFFTEYAAEEISLINDSAPEVRFSFNSVIRAGDCEWQFFMKENYQGFSECLQGTTDPLQYFVPDFTEKFGVRSGDVKSIKLGCDKNCRHDYATALVDS